MQHVSKSVYYSIVNNQDSTTPHATTPASLFIQRHVRTRFDLLRPEVEDRVAANQATQKMHHDRHSRQRDFFVGQRVMVRNLRPGPQWIPGTIIERRGPVTYLVQVAGDRIWKRHIDHLNETTDTPQNQTTLLWPTIEAEGPAETPVSLLVPDASSLGIPSLLSQQVGCPNPLLNLIPLPTRNTKCHYRLHQVQLLQYHLQTDATRNELGGGQTDTKLLSGTHFEKGGEYSIVNNQDNCK